MLKFKQFNMLPHIYLEPGTKLPSGANRIHIISSPYSLRVKDRFRGSGHVYTSNYTTMFYKNSNLY